MAYKITDRDIKSLRVAYTRPKLWPITCLDFHFNGELILETCKEELKIFELQDKVTERMTIKVEKYQAKVAKFYDNQHLVYSSSKDGTIRSLNFAAAPKYVYFHEGHTDEVISLSVTARNYFSGSKDKTVRMWNPRSRAEVGKIQLPDAPLVTNFNDNLLAVAYDSSVIEIYNVGDLKNYVHRWHYEKGARWTGIQFSPDGKMLLITTDSTYILIVSSLKNEVLHELSGYKNPKGIHLDAVFSCDSKYVFGGSSDGRLNVWELETSAPLCSLRSGHVGACERVAFNPEFMNVATTSNSKVLHLWIEKY